MSKGPVGRLFILRHAHSSWALPGQRDHERPLDDRGRGDAPAIGAAMRALGGTVDLVLCSTAVRARQTLDGVRPFLAGAPAERFSDDLYALGPDAYLAAVRAEDAGCVLLVGHNPMVEDFAEALVSGGEAEALGAMKRGFPTAGLALFEFPVPLAAIGPGTGRLKAFLEPGAL